METRGRKRQRVVDLSSQDDLDDLVDSENEDVMCGQFYDDDEFEDKSCSDDEMLCEVCFFKPWFSFF
jgi:hypothetical protein